MKKQYIWLIVAALFFLLPACNNLTTEPDDDGDNPYNPIQLTTKQTGFVEEGNAFSLRLLEKVGKHAIDKGEGNWFVSPLSLQIALGMLLNGAQGETADEICRMLGYGNGETAEVNQWCNLMLEQLQQSAGIELTHIPYKGAGQQLTDGIGGQYELISTNMSPALMAQIESGAFRPLAVAAAERVAFLPDVPTFSELGYAGAGKQSVFGFFAPTGVDAETLARMNSEINKAVAHPGIAALLKDSHNLPLAGDPAQFSELIKADAEANRKLIESAGLTFE